MSVSDSLDLSRYEEIKAAGELPSPKGIALAIARLTQREDATVNDLGRLVQGDPALVARLVKAANTKQGPGARPVASIRDALNLLGFATVRSLALGFSLLSGFRNGNCKNFDYQRFWSLSVLRAIGAQRFCAKLKSMAPEEAFCIGLLAAIGELGLATVFPAQYSRTLDQSRGLGARGVLELERQAFAMTHIELTCAMLVDWGMPRMFVDAVMFHEDPDLSGLEPGSRAHGLLLALALARGVADVCQVQESDRGAVLQQVHRIAAGLGWSGEQLNSEADAICADWLEWAKVLPIDAYQMPEFSCMGATLTACAEQGELCRTRPHESLRVLVVDDDHILRDILHTLLVRAGHEVRVATHGAEGMQMALEFQPQLMVIDWLMPEMDGLELTRMLRQTKIGRSIYILVLTSLEDEDRLIEAFDSGVDDYMVKPLKPRVLSARLQAGQRVIRMQAEIERDREEIRRYASELAVSNRRLQEAALTDPLTGFPNRRYAMERIAQEWTIANRTRKPLACMVIDVDNFKQINDSYGHDVGDAILRHTAHQIKRGLRAQDVICRTGGDEFLVICPDTTLDQAALCAERVRRSVGSAPVEAGRVQLRSAVSIGVAVRDEGMSDADALIKRADQGLYEAKRHGRNRVGLVPVAMAEMPAGP